VDPIAQAIPYTPFFNRDRLIYLTYPDTTVRKSVSDEFIAQGLEVSAFADVSTMTGLIAMRRPDLVILPLCKTAENIDLALETLDAIRRQHLGIHSFVLAPPQVRAEMVCAVMKRGASWVFSAPYVALNLAIAAQELFRGDIHLEQTKGGAGAITVRGFHTLTYRERQILQFIIDGRTNKEMAVDLGLSPRTVEQHRRHIMEKIGARNTAELVRLAIET
jgi:two-component system response regulator FixJ